MNFSQIFTKVLRFDQRKLNHLYVFPFRNLCNVWQEDLGHQEIQADICMSRTLHIQSQTFELRLRKDLRSIYNQRTSWRSAGFEETPVMVKIRVRDRDHTGLEITLALVHLLQFVLICPPQCQPEGCLGVFLTCCLKSGHPVSSVIYKHAHVHELQLNHSDRQFLNCHQIWTPFDQIQTKTLFYTPCKASNFNSKRLHLKKRLFP